MKAVREIAVAVIVLALILLFFNALLSSSVWVPAGNPILIAVPIVEALVVLWVLVLARRFARTDRGRNVATVIVGGLAGYLIAFSAAETLFQYIYARSFIPTNDIPAVRSGLLLLLGDIGDIVYVLTPVVVVLLFVSTAALGVGLASGASALIGRLRRPSLGAAIVSLAGVVALAVTGATAVPVAGQAVVRWFEDPTLKIVQIEVPDRGQMPAAGDAGEEDVQAASPVHRFPGILDRDIIVFAVEAYGYATFSRPDFAETFRPVRNRLAQALAEKGYGVRTSFLRSPVAGGFSWLAEATFLTGQWVPTEEAFAQLYDVDLPSVSRMLHEGGYYTFTVRPGTVHSSWPEAWTMYRFEEAMVAHDGDFDYDGPMFSYVWITDQFAIWSGYNRIRELTSPGGPAENRPLFAYFQLVSSHTPFNRIPPIIEDWEDLEGGDVYWERSDEIEEFDNTWTSGNEWIEGYTAAITHSFDVITKFVDELLETDRNPIIIVFGDHQAQRPIREQRAHLSVPIHVASRDPEILGLFAAAGYDAGMSSSLPPPHPDMSTFFPTFAGIAHSPPIPEEIPLR